MSDTFDSFIGGVGRLPNPETDPQFYDGVPSRRLIAWAIDFVGLWLLAALFVVLTLGLGLFLLGLFVVAVDFAHRVISISSGSATIGMRLMRIELRGRDGRRFHMGQAIGHTLLYYIAGMSVIAQVISVIMMSGSSLGRGLHDLPFGSTMINSPE
ncbi:MAG: RDD family protein [Pseudomonadota bacterium]